MRRVGKIVRASRLINGRKKKSISKSLKPPQTYDTRCPRNYVYSLKIRDVPEVNVFDKKKVQITFVLLMFLSFRAI